MEHEEWKYQFQIKREATKGIDGFTILVNEDNADAGMLEAKSRYQEMKEITKAPQMEVK